MFLKAQKALVPKPVVLPDPVPHRGEPFGKKPVAAFAPVSLFGQETGIE